MSMFNVGAGGGARVYNRRPAARLNHTYTCICIHICVHTHTHFTSQTRAGLAAQNRIQLSKPGDEADSSGGKSMQKVCC